MLLKDVIKEKSYFRDIRHETLFLDGKQTAELEICFKIEKTDIVLKIVGTIYLFTWLNWNVNVNDTVNFELSLLDFIYISLLRYLFLVCKCCSIETWKIDFRSISKMQTTIIQGEKVSNCLEADSISS